MKTITFRLVMGQPKRLKVITISSSDPSGRQVQESVDLGQSLLKKARAAAKEQIRPVPRAGLVLGTRE